MVEEALRAGEARYRAIVESTPMMNCRFQTDGTLTFVDDPCCRDFALEPDGLTGFNFRVRIPVEVQPLIDQRIAALKLP